MTLYEQLMAWAQNQWLVVAVLVSAGAIIYLSGLLQHVQTLYSKLFSGERLLRRSGLEFVRIEAFKSKPYWKSSESAKVMESGSRYPAPDYVDRSSLVFQLSGRYDTDPNPTLDIILTNTSATRKILLSYGIEVLDARYRVISGGSVNKITLEETEHYKIAFPVPNFVTGQNAYDQSDDSNATHRMPVSSETYKGNGALSSGEMDSAEGLLFWEWEWADTPVLSMINVDDPPHLASGEPYRFTLEIEKSERMPTDTLLRVLVKTDNGDFRSDRIYFLKT